MEMTHWSAASTQALRTDVYVCQIEHGAVAVAVARRTARTVLTGWAVPEEAVHDAVLVVSELVTNAVEHALPPVALRLYRGEADGTAIIRVEVTDGGPAPQQGPWIASCGPEEHGRGARIVDSLGIGTGIGSRNRGGGRWADLIAA
jgi:anti-sigma regulatory factor (Ser/Thr protein kinase)